MQERCAGKKRVLGTVQNRNTVRRLDYSYKANDKIVRAHLSRATVDAAYARSVHASADEASVGALKANDILFKERNYRQPSRPRNHW